MRKNVGIYFCSIKIHASDSMNSWKAFSASCWLWKHFPLQNVVQMCEGGVVGQWAVRWGCRRALSVDQGQLQVLQFSVLIDLLSTPFRCNGFVGIQKALTDQMGSRSPNSECDLFWCNFGFGNCFGASQSNHCIGHLWLSYKIHSLLHITIWSRNSSLLLHRIREDNPSKSWFFDFWSVHEATTTFPICFQCRMTIDWSMLSSSATSHVIVRGSASMMALNWSLSTSDGQPLCSSSPRLSSPLQSFLNHRCTVCLLAVLGPNGLTLQVFYAMYNPLRIWIKTVAQIFFLSNISSKV